MKKVFEKNEVLFSILLIIIYVVINMICVQNFGNTSLVSVIVNSVFSILLILLIIYLKRISYYGLVMPNNIKSCLYFIPLVLIVSVNLWSGININNTKEEIIYHILTMINIGFLEEIIFRGFLFKAMAKDNVKSAIVVSSLTFGIGHIVNLLNGADLVPTIIQIISAISIGYLFVMIFHCSNSLIPCIVAHGLINSFSIFYKENDLLLYLTGIFLIIVPFVYSIVIKKMNEKYRRYI